MSFLDRFRGKKSDTASTKKELDAVKKTALKEVTTLIKPTGVADQAFYVLQRPHVSEKAAGLTSQGTYVFDVSVTAEKVSIKKAVESLYKVNVIGVRTIRHAGKHVYRGRHNGDRNAWKKALVTLKKGQKIDLYEGV